jgi:hypothetical protein
VNAAIRANRHYLPKDSVDYGMETSPEEAQEEIQVQKGTIKGLFIFFVFFWD